MKCPNCNETDHEPTAKYCHVCGSVLVPKRIEETRLGFKWSKVLRYLLLIFILVEYVFISIMEYHLYGQWGLVSILIVNSLSFILTLLLCISANNDYYDEEKGVWRLYYNWLHFLTAVIVPVIGLLICGHIQNLFTIFLDMALAGLLLLADSGTLEDLIDVL